MSVFMKNEWVRLKKSKVTFVVIIAIPILITFLLGWELHNGMIENIPIVVCDLDESNLSRTILGYFENEPAYNVNKYVTHPNEVEKTIREGKAAMGIVIPKGFSSDVTNLKMPTILMVYEGSNLPLTSVTKVKATEILATVKAGVTVKQMEARAGMTGNEAMRTAVPISMNRVNLYNPTGSFQYYLMPGLMLAVVQTGIAMAAAAAIRWDEEKNEYKSIREYVFWKITFYGVVGFVVILICLLMLIYGFRMPFRGSFAQATLLSLGLSFAVSGLGCVVSQVGNIIKNQYLAIIFTGVLILPNAIMTGYTWPVSGMPFGYQIAAYIFPFYYAAGNMRRLFLADTLAGFWPAFGILCLYSVLMYVLCAMLIKGETKIRSKGKTGLRQGKTGDGSLS